MLITTTPTKFNTTPSRTMVWMVKRPVAKVITFGGVATGNMNAHEALGSDHEQGRSGRRQARQLDGHQQGRRRHIAGNLCQKSDG